MTAVVLVVAAVVLVLPGRPAEAGPPVRRAGASRHGDRLLLPGAVALTGVACVVAAGMARGAVAAAVVCPLAWWALERLRRRPTPRPEDPGLPIALDLVAAGLRGGRPPADALSRAAPATDAVTCAELLRVAGLLRLGAEPALAWAAVRDGPLAPVGTVAVRSAASGIRIATAFEALATDLRRDRRAAAAMRAHRAGVHALGPLAACFLPSFVCLGIVPVVVGIARHALGVLP